MLRNTNAENDRGVVGNVLWQYEKPKAKNCVRKKT